MDPSQASAAAPAAPAGFGRALDRPISRGRGREPGGRRVDALEQYLRDVSAYPLISRVDEVALAARIRADDEEALHELVRANLRFVVAVATKYQHQGVPLLDLISEGNLGLIRAARRFDESKGLRFITYAVWWVRQAILLALADQSRVLRLPVNRVGTLHRVGKSVNAMFQRLGREPTLAELAEAVDVSEPELAKLLAVAQPHQSLDAPAVEGESTRLADRLAAPSAGSVDALVDRPLAEAVTESLARLKEREATILRLYYGLDGEDPRTLEEIGARFGITRERVRQIKERALRRLGSGSTGASLAAYRGADR